MANGLDPVVAPLVGVVLGGDVGAEEALGRWLVDLAAREDFTSGRILDAAAVAIAAIDRSLSRQVDAILHHEAYRTLEASWRGLWWLVSQAEMAVADGGARVAGRRVVRVHLLPCSKKELLRDLEAFDFDSSEICRKVYDEQFAILGGEPFGLIVVDHVFGNKPSDLECLGALAEIGAASFAPVVASPAADLLDVDTLSGDRTGLPLRARFEGSAFTKWRSLCAREDSRFVGMVVPRVLARLPHDGWIGSPGAPSQVERAGPGCGFRYRESLSARDGGDRVWASAVWAFAGVVVREFGRTGWFAAIRGAARGKEGGGLVEGLPAEGFFPDDTEVLRGPTEVIISDAAERGLAEAGFIPLCAVGGEGRAVFHSNQSIHRVDLRGTTVVDVNARLASMLQYVLCASRFAHRLKILARKKVGSFSDAESLERFLGDWLKDYVTDDPDADPVARAQHPLRAAELQVREREPGVYQMLMHLQPHTQIDDTAASITLQTRFGQSGSS
jgi:type VI secretion system protein ImpD